MCSRKSADKKLRQKKCRRKIAAEKSRQKKSRQKSGKKIAHQHGWGLFMRDMAHLV
jgi:hypothetical protein